MRAWRTLGCVWFNLSWKESCSRPPKQLSQQAVNRGDWKVCFPPTWQTWTKILKWEGAFEGSSLSISSNLNALQILTGYMIFYIIFISPYKFRDRCSLLKRTVWAPLDCLHFEAHSLTDRCQVRSAHVHEQTQPGRITQLFYNSIFWILFSYQSDPILWWGFFFLLKIFFL